MDSLVAAYAPSFLPIIIGVRPQLSRAQIMPSSVNIIIVHDPLIWRNTFSIPSLKVLPWIMSSATSSVGLVLPEDISAKCMFLSSNSLVSSLIFTIFATVQMANLPRCEFIINGWASVSLITPIPDVAPSNLSRFASNLVLK